MKVKGTPIQRKLMRIFMLTSGIVLVITCATFTVYEYFSFRESARDNLATVGKIIAANSTAALAFDNQEDANELLSGLRTEKHIVAACLYDENGRIFAKYPPNIPDDQLPMAPGRVGFRFTDDYLEGFQPVIEQVVPLGTLYLKSDMEAMYERLRLYSLITALVIIASFLLGYIVSRRLQKRIIRPILHLAATSRSVTKNQDYSVRAEKTYDDDDELGELTDAFNSMLSQIESQNDKITSFNQELEEKIRKRTSELENANNELAVVNSKLIKSNRDLEQFAYVSSHDLQEPLRKIRTFSELAGRNPGNREATQTYINKISSSAERMAALIKSVLNYSRLSKADDHQEWVDLNKTIDEVRTDFELLLTEKNGQIIKEELPVVLGMPLQLHQLFYNLVSNSLKFADKDPEIRVSARRVAAKDLDLPKADHLFLEYHEVRFKDNGIGFEQIYADKVFAIFQRLHDRQNYPGTGIGLALCKKIVENHNGFIKVQSELGKGAEFYIYLPVL